MTSAFIQWSSPKSHSQGIFNGRVLRTHLLIIYIIRYEVITGLRCRIWPYFMFIKVRNFIAPNFTGEYFRIQVRSPFDNYDYGCRVTPVTRGAHWYLSYQKGIIQGHPGHKYATREALRLCSRIVFRAVKGIRVGYNFIDFWLISCFTVNWALLHNWIQNKFSTVVGNSATWNIIPNLRLWSFAPWGLENIAYIKSVKIFAGYQMSWEGIII